MKKKVIWHHEKLAARTKRVLVEIKKIESSVCNALNRTILESDTAYHLRQHVVDGKARKKEIQRYLELGLTPGQVAGAMFGSRLIINDTAEGIVRAAADEIRRLHDEDDEEETDEKR